VQEVWVTTISGKSYMEAVSAFSTAVERMFEKNEVNLT